MFRLLEGIQWRKLSLESTAGSLQEEPFGQRGHQDDVVLRAHHGQAEYTVFRRVALVAVSGH